MISLELQKEKYCNAQVIACEETADKQKLLTRGSDSQREPLKASANHSYYQPSTHFPLLSRMLLRKNEQKDYILISEQELNTSERSC